MGGYAQVARRGEAMPSPSRAPVRENGRCGLTECARLRRSESAWRSTFFGRDGASLNPIDSAARASRFATISVGTLLALQCHRPVAVLSWSYLCRYRIRGGFHVLEDEPREDDTLCLTSPSETPQYTQSASLIDDLPLFTHELGLVTHCQFQRCP